VILLLPETRLVPFTVMEAAATVRDAERVAVPSVPLPRTKETVPVGAILPLDGTTVAVRVVEALEAREDGLAVSDVVVATGACDTITDTEPLEFEKLPEAT
jgi:hypothetical protein